MIFFRTGLFLLYAKRLARSFSCLMSHDNNLADSRVFFFTNGNHIQTPGANGLIGDKYEYWLREAEKSGITISHLLNPFASLPNYKCQRVNVFIEALIFVPIKKHAPRKFVRELFTSGEVNYSLRNRAIFRIYCVVISKFKPTVILGIALPPTLCLAASIYGVQTAEFQHGAGYKEEFDFKGDRRFIPNLLLSWHKVYTDAAHSYGRKSINVGFPIIEESMNSNNHLPIESLAQARILFTLSYSVSNSVDRFSYVHKEVAEAILELQDLVKSVTLRLHPSIEADLELIPWRRFNHLEIIETLTKQFPGVSIDFPSERSLMQSLQTNDLHISYNSSSIFEASIAGVPTILLSKEKLRQLLPEEVENNRLVCYAGLPELKRVAEGMLLAPKSRINNRVYSSVIADLLYTSKSI